MYIFYFKEDVAVNVASRILVLTNLKCVINDAWYRNDDIYISIIIKKDDNDTLLHHVGGNIIESLIKTLADNEFILPEKYESKVKDLETAVKRTIQVFKGRINR